MSGTHRHTNGPEHDFEPERGLPESLPRGERLIWQGSPDAWALAREAFHVRKLVVYFAALLSLRAGFVLSDGGGALAALTAAAWLLPLALLAIGLVGLMAWMSARAAIYTITDRRVVMRIGIVLTVTFNLPYRCVTAAGLKLHHDGSGDLPLTLQAGNHIGWLQLWPHVRPWQVRSPQPMLRAVPDAKRVAALLAQAWSGATGRVVAPAAAQTNPAPAASTGGHEHGGSAQPALAGQ